MDVAASDVERTPGQFFWQSRDGLNPFLSMPYPWEAGNQGMDQKPKILDC